MEVFHITWVTHNSRVSERMKECRVKVGNRVILNLAERREVCSYLNEKIKKEKYKVIALNVLSNHVHLILACKRNKRDEIIRNLKGYSSFNFSQAHSGLKPTVSELGSRHLWARKYGYYTISNNEYFYRAVEYVRNNHLGHNLPALEQEILSEATTRLENIENLYLY